jgi:ubiquinone/menaquinone biosynthesis C-methylase UbiE
MSGANNEEIGTCDQAFYDQRPVGSLEDHGEWMREIEFYYLGYADKLNELLAGSNGFVAELGAGSCGLSVCLTRLPNVKRVSSLDISMKRMQKMIDTTVTVLEGDKQKITPIACDFNGRLPFEDGELDAVVFDAALHHTRSMWYTLSECNRVLKRGGALIAQRESYLNSLRAKSQIANLLKTPEISANVSENMYLREQYIYYLQVSGFEVNFIKRTPSALKRILMPLNGVAFCDGVLICAKK